jgi:predicted SAM-dependent methyltransferase
LIENELLIATKSLFYKLIKRNLYAGKHNLKLYLGCGNTYKNGWINIDVRGTYDMVVDLRGNMPFDDNSAILIFSEHFIEHLDYPDVVLAHLRECYRVLSKNGTLRIGVPDTRWPVKCYLEGKDSTWLRLSKKRYWHPEWCVTPMDHLNFHFRQNGEHKYAYDFETLKNVLCVAGFTEIKKKKYDSNTDSHQRKVGTLYINAKK